MPTTPAQPALTAGGSTPAPPGSDPSPRDFCAPHRLLLTERANLIPLLRRVPQDWFERQTACPGWSVRDVLAHCAAALTRIAEDRIHDFSPERNQEDVDDRKNHSTTEIIDELEHGYSAAGPVIAAAGGTLDVIALGEWVHAGDVRAAFGITPAYAADGTDDALTLLSACSRDRNTPLLTASLPDRDLQMGTWLPGQQARARLTTDADTLIRLYTGRPLAEGHYSLAGASHADLVIYR